MDPKKIEVILSWPSLRTVHDVQVFLGFANYYQRFILGYSKIVAPLTDLLKGKPKGPVKWGDNQKAAFETLKRAFTEGPVLQHFDPTQPIRLWTDASDQAIAAKLAQPKASPDTSARLWHPVAFRLRKLNPAERNYKIHNKELLAIVDALRDWKQYCQNAAHKIAIHMDHRGLEYFQSKRSLNVRQARWALLLADYEFKIYYKPGSQCRVDGLTRRADMHEGPNTRNPLNERVLLGTEVFVHLAARALGYDEFKQELRKLYNGWEPPAKDKKGLEKKDGLWMHNDLVYVPRVDDRCARREQVTRLCHDAPAAGHGGPQRTLELIHRLFYWPGMASYVERYVRTCVMCKRAKAPRHAPYGLLESLPTPKRPWGSVTIDFIKGLPASGVANYDSIMVVVDRLTKYGVFIPCWKTTNALDTAQLFLERVFSQFGAPDTIVSDRGCQFVSSMWRTFVQLLNGSIALSTAYHPQTDGQTERLNQSLEQYLRIYVEKEQHEWSRHLPMAQFALNNATSATTKMSPFFAVMGVAHCQKAIDAATALAALQYDKRRAAKSYSVGDQVYLRTANLAMRLPSHKLGPKLAGPFEILEQIGRKAYRLQLPASWRCHPVFGVAMLEPDNGKVDPRQTRQLYPDEGLLAARDNRDEIVEYEVERVGDSRRAGEGLEHLVHWQDGTSSWEPREHLQHSQQLTREFHAQYPRRPKP
ncbi:FOG: Transposon-encoded proteins with TYA, reverse transcriptase, integrase domains in various combinations [Ceraceosorus bombacis]|uniref:FOG: Transposon-encoded proteins with TYA, reverse transcriptase, integrase domains in various combinations n=1 Tax=Ceraceosorus bombacis TaxID=401625 RepID=A0A0P1B9H2_9BASI|nr:FOG: Transposon-encoded proteins with TYA, reverse transcriptase, integrase domains in various combinations [Ceraceosorus bombacis]